MVVIALTASTSAFGGAWGGSLGAATDYVFRGLSQSDGQPSAQGDGHYYWNTGAFAGLWGATVERGMDRGTTAEFNAYLGYAWPIGSDCSAKVTAIHYDYPWNRPRRRYNYDELAATAAYVDYVFLTVTASPDTSRESTRYSTDRRAAFSYDLILRLPLPHDWSVNGGIGYYDLHRVLGAGYVYWNAGVGYALGPVQFEVSYIGTNATAKTLFYDNAAQNRWVASALWHF